MVAGELHANGRRRGWTLTNEGRMVHDGILRAAREFGKAGAELWQRSKAPNVHHATALSEKSRKHGREAAAFTPLLCLLIDGFLFVKFL